MNHVISTRSRGLIWRMLRQISKLLPYSIYFLLAYVAQAQLKLVDAKNFFFLFVRCLMNTFCGKRSDLKIHPNFSGVF